MSALQQSFAIARVATFAALVIACADVTVPIVGDGPSATAAKGKPKPTPIPEPDPDPAPQPAPDLTAPTVPVFAIKEVGPNHVVLQWSSTDASLPILYYVAKTGGVSTLSFDSTGTYAALQPTTTYTFVAKARDMAGNWSAFSAPFSVTTTAPDPNDVTPPTAPTNLWAGVIDDSAREFAVYWTRSIDNITPQSAIIYHVYVNGRHENSSAGVPQSSGYGDAGENIITVIAVDAAGNRSVAGSFTLVM
jgi:hypothetical protein